MTTAKTRSNGRRNAPDAEQQYITVYRRSPVAQIEVGDEGIMPFESAVLHELAEVVANAVAYQQARTDDHEDAVPHTGAFVAHGIVHDRFEAEYGRHRVVVLLGDAAETAS